MNRELGQLTYGPISGWENIPLKERWEAHFDVPIYLENEAHASAIGVYHEKTVQGIENFIYVSLGVGLAAGVIVDGVLIRGQQSYAGQVGHMHVADNGIPCGCGKQGCWVTEVGAEAIVRKLRAGGIELPSSSENDWVDWILGQASDGNPVVLEVLEDVAKHLGHGVARLVQAFNPKAVIVGGRLGRLIQALHPSIQESMFAETRPYMNENIELVIRTSRSDPERGCLATVFDAVMQNPMMD